MSHWNNVFWKPCLLDKYKLKMEGAGAKGNENSYHNPYLVMFLFKKLEDKYIIFFKNLN